MLHDLAGDWDELWYLDQIHGSAPPLPDATVLEDVEIDDFKVGTLQDRLLGDDFDQ